MALTKADIVNEVMNENGYGRRQATDKVEALLGLIKKTFASGEDVLINGFGKFCVKQKKERRGRNRAIGEDMMLAPRKVVTFKCSGKLRGKINASYPTSINSKIHSRIIKEVLCYLMAGSMY